MPNSTEQIKAKAIQILNSKEASEINFTMFGVTISGTIFPIIARDLQEEHPTFLARKVEIGVMAKGVAAVYSSTDNTLYFSRTDYLDGRLFATSVIHEAVHAWVDRILAGYLTVWENEALAYVSHHIYARKVHLGLRRFISTNHRPAWVIADQILRGLPPSEKTVRWLVSTIRANEGLSEFGTRYTVADG